MIRTEDTGTRRIFDRENPPKDLSRIIASLKDVVYFETNVYHPSHVRIKEFLGRNRKKGDTYEIHLSMDGNNILVDKQEYDFDYLFNAKLDMAKNGRSNEKNLIRFNLSTKEIEHILKAPESHYSRINASNNLLHRLISNYSESHQTQLTGKGTGYVPVIA